MKIAYIAGPMTPHGNRLNTQNAAIEYLLNIRDMIQVAIGLIAKGYAPYCPALDYQYFLSLTYGETITEDAIKAISMAFLDVSDIIVFLPGWEASAGCQAEYSRAVEIGMPSFYGVRSVPNEIR